MAILVSETYWRLLCNKVTLIHKSVFAAVLYICIYECSVGDIVLLWLIVSLLFGHNSNKQP
jgi:hypothetical protein